VLLFKHSNACPISGRAHEEVADFLGGQPDPAFGFAMIVVQTARPLSNVVADRLGVEHESPQAIVVRNGEAVWSTSHWNITRKSLEEALAAK
jgi:bacillithiol system protein YtxJ